MRLERQKTARDKSRFEKLRAELVSLAEADQSDLIQSISQIAVLSSKAEQRRQGRQLFARCHRRAEKMLKILHTIKEPRISQIGRDGCEAILLLTQHSYLKIMKEVLATYLLIDTIAPEEVPRNRLPALIDRVLVLENGQQRYGTQWMNTEDGTPFLIQLENFDIGNKKRLEFGLKPIMKPVSHTHQGEEYPLGHGPATKQDQRRLDRRTYRVYSENCLRRIP